MPDSQNLIPLLLDLLSLFLWMYVASSFGRGRDAFFNLYVNRVRRLLFQPVAFVQRLFPRMADWGAALALMGAAAAARILASRSAYAPHGWEHAARAATAPLQIMCGLNIIRAAMQWRARPGGARECLDTLCFPLSQPAPARSAAASAAALFALALAYAGFSHDYGGAVSDALRMLADTLLILRGVIGAGFLAYIAGLVSGRREIIGMGNEWLDAVSRIFTRQPLTFAMIDLTPLIIYAAAGYLHSALMRHIP